MSAETQAALHAAIAAHLADEENGAIVAGSVLIVVGQTIDDALIDPEHGARSRGLWLNAPGQLWPMTFGLIEELRLLTHHDYESGLGD